MVRSRANRKNTMVRWILDLSDSWLVDLTQVKICTPVQPRGFHVQSIQHGPWTRSRSLLLCEGWGGISCLLVYMSSELSHGSVRHNNSSLIITAIWSIVHYRQLPMDPADLMWISIKLITVMWQLKCLIISQNNGMCSPASKRIQMHEKVHFHFNDI